MTSDSASIPEKKSIGKDTEAYSVPLEEVYRPDVDTSDLDERKLMRKIDWHVVPWLALLYLLNFLDRGSIGNAKVSMNTFVSQSHD